MVGEIEVDGNSAVVNLKLTITGCPAAQKIERDTIAAASKVEGIENVSVVLGVMTEAERAVLKEQLRGGRAVRTNPFDEDTYTRIYLVGSGKGGVGKSSITANLAVALAMQGNKVGLIDADIFGFSIPGQLGITGKPTKVDDLILPPVFEVESGNGFVKVISIGMFVEEGKAVAWRGPMLHRAIQQFLTDVHWGDLDFLLVDLPPELASIAAGEFSDQVVPKGKAGPKTRHGARHGLNDYTAWFAQDHDMAGEYYGYDGPCPPWNDALIHRYQFALHAIDLERLPLEGRFTGPQVLAAMQGHLLARATISGCYSLNPRLAAQPAPQPAPPA
jgi:Mrp family chromosome partitioning ATPase